MNIESLIKKLDAGKKHIETLEGQISAIQEKMAQQAKENAALAQTLQRQLAAYLPAATGKVAAGGGGKTKKARLNKASKAALLETFSGLLKKKSMSVGELAEATKTDTTTVAYVLRSLKGLKKEGGGRWTTYRLN